MTLAASGVAYARGGTNGFCLPRTDLTVREGTITALVGPSGSGKSTLAQLLAGLISPDIGSVTCDGENVLRRRGRLPAHTALIDQDPAAAADPRLSLRQMIGLPARLRRLQIEVDPLAIEVGLELALLDKFPGDVSGGQLQRACIARALAQQSRYLIADEVTAHLDPEDSHTIAAALRARADRGLGVLMITHDPLIAHRWADVTHTMGSSLDSE